MFKLKRKRLIALVVLTVLLVFFVDFIRHKYVIPIIMYHSINPGAQRDNRIEITPENFERQMRFLKERHYNVVTLEKAADFIKNKKRAPVKTIAITFDDGYKDNYTYAFPILKKYNFPATIFIIVNEVERPEGDRLSWDEINTMQASGLITFGSHTFNHLWLPEVTSEEILKNEVLYSKKALEEKLGREVSVFCYPGGRLNERVRQAVINAGYQAAVVTNPGKKISDSDVFALKRLRISANCDNLFVFWVETSGYYNLIRENRRK